VCGDSGWVLVIMDEVGCNTDAVDANIDMHERVCEAGRAGGAIAMASFNYRSRSLSRSRWRWVSF